MQSFNEQSRTMNEPCSFDWYYPQNVRFFSGTQGVKRLSLVAPITISALQSHLQTYNGLSTGPVSHRRIFGKFVRIEIGCVGSVWSKFGPKSALATFLPTTLTMISRPTADLIQLLPECSYDTYECPYNWSESFLVYSVILLQSCTTVHTSMDRKRRLQLVEAALLLDDDLNEAIDDLGAVQQADAPGERRRKRKRWWVRPWILHRPLFG